MLAFLFTGCNCGGGENYKLMPGAYLTVMTWLQDDWESNEPGDQELVWWIINQHGNPSLRIAGQDKVRHGYLDDEGLYIFETADSPCSDGKLFRMEIDPNRDKRSFTAYGRTEFWLKECDYQYEFVTAIDAVGAYDSAELEE